MRRLLTTTALVALISAPAMAGSDLASPKQLAQAAQPTDTPTTQNAPAPSPAAVFLRDKHKVGLGTIAASTLIGAPSYTADKESIGEVGDVILTTDGKLRSAIIDVGGFLGIGEKPVEIGFEDLEVYRDDAGELHIVTPFSEEQLNKIVAYVPESERTGGANSMTPEG